jgi:hypothetical protein
VLQIELAAPAVLRWLTQDRRVRVLHHNAEILTLVDEVGQVCSLVSATRGLGPFAGVVRGGELGSLKAGEGEVRGGVVSVGRVCFEAAGAVVWDPRVRWRGVPAVSASAPMVADRSLAESASALTVAVDHGDWESAVGAVRHLAGRGPGLTPLGDDLVLGVLLALHARRHPWITRAADLADLVAAGTTTLSAAWVRAAARGEGAIAWHQLAAADSPQGFATAIRAIRRWGSSSGEAAWGSFAVVAREQKRRPLSPKGAVMHEA